VTPSGQPESSKYRKTIAVHAKKSWIGRDSEKSGGGGEKGRKLMQTMKGNC